MFSVHYFTQQLYNTINHTVLVHGKRFDANDEDNDLNGFSQII